MVDLGQKKVNSCLPFFMRQILGWRAKRSRLPYCSKRSFTFFKQQTKFWGGEQSEAVYHTAQNARLPFLSNKLNSGVASKAKPFTILLKTLVYLFLCAKFWGGEQSEAVSQSQMNFFFIL
ncbi:hypothetical protein [Patiriisocius sp. Uisw_017]|uniref:hypothetical protein n=1 Tax=Patiriisocius sp. Uisw_017 TaxID=3230968 RepID=UPI0039E84911